MNLPIKTLTNMGSRERSLIYAYVLLNADTKDVVLEFGYTLNVVVVGEGKKGKVTTWYSAQELSKVAELVHERIKSDAHFIVTIRNNFFDKWSKLMTYITKEKEFTNFKEAYEVYVLYYEWWSQLSYVLDASKVSEEIKTEYQNWRVSNEKYTEEIDKLFVEFIVKIYPQYESIKNIITPDEMLSLDAVSFSDADLQIIHTRENGFVLFENNTYSIDYLGALLDEKGIVLDSEEPDQIHDSLNGIIANKGTATGKCRVVLYKEDLANLQDGEILIAEATTPDYICAIAKASAVVTNEGGLMSHAAISCRELKRPCIVGTAWATKTFKTGEIVEVDASGQRGIVSRKIDIA